MPAPPAYLEHHLRLYSESHPGTHRCRHVAIVTDPTRRHRIVTIGFNQAKTHPLQQKYSRNPKKLHRHAEIDAIVQVARKGFVFAELDLFVGRIIRGQLRQSMPCPGCWAALDAFGFQSVSWTTDDGTIESLRTC
jgi:hypothetical protein